MLVPPRCSSFFPGATVIISLSLAANFRGGLYSSSSWTNLRFGSDPGSFFSDTGFSVVGAPADEGTAESVFLCSSFSSKAFDTQVAGVCVCWTPASGVLHTLSLDLFSKAGSFCAAGAGAVQTIGPFSPPRASMPTVMFASPANDPCATGACLFSPTPPAGACLVSPTSTFEFFRLIILCHGSSVAGLLCSTARAHGDANDLASQAP